MATVEQLTQLFDDLFEGVVTMGPAQREMLSTSATEDISKAMGLMVSGKRRAGMTGVLEQLISPAVVADWSVLNTAAENADSAAVPSTLQAFQAARLAHDPAINVIAIACCLAAEKLYRVTPPAPPD